MPRYMRTTRCTVEVSAGQFCDADQAPGMPFPICAPHAIKLYRCLQAMVDDVTDHPQDHPDIYARVIAGFQAKNNTKQHRVYYVRVGDLIKIGVSRRLGQRMNAYPPGSELLAVEVGGEDLEGRRHAQFRHLLASRKEWFHPGDDLMAHIAGLKASA